MASLKSRARRGRNSSRLAQPPGIAHKALSVAPTGTVGSWARVDRRSRGRLCDQGERLIRMAREVLPFYATDFWECLPGIAKARRFSPPPRFSADPAVSRVQDPDGC